MELYQRMRDLAILQTCEPKKGQAAIDAHAAWLRAAIGLRVDDQS